MIAKSLKRALPAKLACLCPHPSDSSEGLRLPRPKGQAGEHPWTSPRSTWSSAGLTPQVHTAFISFGTQGKLPLESRARKGPRCQQCPSHCLVANSFNKSTAPIPERSHKFLEGPGGCCHTKAFSDVVCCQQQMHAWLG